VHVYNYGHPYVNVWDLSRSIGPTRKKCIPRRKAPAAPYKEKEKIVQFLLLGPFTMLQRNKIWVQSLTAGCK